MFKLKTLLPVIIGLLLVVSSVVFAAVPSGTPPACDDVNNPGCQPPINVSLSNQTKKGNLFIEKGLSAGSLLSIGGAAIMGNLGIGAASPGSKLFVQGSGADFFNLALLKNTNLAGSSVISFNSGGADAFWGINGPNRTSGGQPLNPNQVFMGNANTNGGFLIFTGGGEPTNERMRITSTGNVGIGTTNPTSKLQVNGSVTIADGTQGVGKVLTSDANGKASWGTGGGGGSGTGLEALNKHYFITASTYNGNLGGVAGANTKCNADANAIAGKSYRAMLYGQDKNYLLAGGNQTLSFHRDFRLKFYNSYYGESRSVFTVGFTDGSVGPDTNSSKYKNSSSGFWLGGLLSGYHCLNWTSSNLFKRATTGGIHGAAVPVGLDVGLIFTSGDSNSCAALAPLLCVEG